MKFLLQIEVEAPEHDGNPDFPRSVHAIQRLQDWLADSRTAQLHSLMDSYKTDAVFPNDEFKRAYIEVLKEEVKFIDASVLTVKEANSPCDEQLG
jgi:hypothetical protein